MSVHKGQKLDRPKYKWMFEQERGKAVYYRKDAQEARDECNSMRENAVGYQHLIDAAQLEAAYYRKWAVRFGVAALLLSLLVLGMLFR